MEVEKKLSLGRIRIRRIQGLSSEVLNIDFGQRAAKIPEVKVGIQKKYLPIGPVPTHAPGVSRVGRYFFRPPTLTSGIFAAL